MVGWSAQIGCRAPALHPPLPLLFHHASCKIAHWPRLKTPGARRPNCSLAGSTPCRQWRRPWTFWDGYIQCNTNTDQWRCVSAFPPSNVETQGPEPRSRQLGGRTRGGGVGRHVPEDLRDDFGRGSFWLDAQWQMFTASVGQFHGSHDMTKGPWRGRTTEASSDGVCVWKWEVALLAGEARLQLPGLGLL